MERDVHALRTVLTRLQQLLPVLDEADRAALREHVKELQNELARIAAAVQST